MEEVQILKSAYETRYSFVEILKMTFRAFINPESFKEIMKLSLRVLFIMFVIFITWKSIKFLFNKKRLWKQEMTYRNTEDLKKEVSEIKEQFKQIKDKILPPAKQAEKKQAKKKKK
jgi:biopolymer transport protein ExbB/TolQ